MVAIKEVLENDDIVVVTSQGVVIRQPAKTIRVAGRNTQGVRLIRLDDKDRIADIAVVPSEDEKEEGKETPELPSTPVKEKAEQPTLFEAAETKADSKSKKQPASGKAAKKKKKK